MVRIKMPLRTIEGEAHRNAVFMKRRVAIKKKAMELEKLCGVETLLVCFGPRGQLETWPEDSHQVRRIMEEYSRLDGDDRTKRHYDLSSFFEAHLKKLQADLDKARSSWIDAATAAAAASEPASLQDLLRSIDVKLAEIDEKIYRAQVEEVERERREGACWEQQLEALETAMPLAELPPIVAHMGDIPQTDGERFVFGGREGDPYPQPLMLPDRHGFDGVDPSTGFPWSFYRSQGFPLESRAECGGGINDFYGDHLFMGGGWENSVYDGTMWPAASSMVPNPPPSAYYGDEIVAPAAQNGAVGDPSVFLPAAATSSHIRHQLSHPAAAASSHIPFLR